MRDDPFEPRSLEAQGADELVRDLRAEVRSLGVDEHTTDDVVQETLLRGWQRLSSITNPRGWLRVVAMRLTFHVQRSERHRKQREERVARSLLVDRTEGAEESRLLRYVREIPHPYREVIELRYFEDREIPEIAVILGRPQATVRSQLKRGLERLRKRIDESDSGRSRLAAILLVARSSFRRRPSALALGAAGACIVLVLAWLAWRADSGVRVENDAIAATSPGGSQPATLLPAGAIGSRTHEETPAPVRPPEVDTRRVVAGRVFDPEGGLVGGAAVYVGRATGPLAGPAVRTDAQGRYTIRVDEGDQFVWAHGSGWSPSRRRMLFALPDREPCDLLLPRSGRVGVRIVSPDGEPIAGARIVASEVVDGGFYLSTRHALEAGPAPFEGTTDRDGRIDLRAASGGTFTLRVAAEGYPVWQEEIDPASSDERTVALPGPAGIEGRILDEHGYGVADARVEVLQVEESVRLATESAADGSFQIGGLAPGRVTLRAWEESGWNSGLYDGWLEEGDRQRVELVLDRDHTVFGHAIGVPPGSTVRATPQRPSDRRTRQVEVRKDGRFALPACEPALEHRLELVAPHSPVLCAWARAVPGEECLLEPKSGTFDVRSVVVQLDTRDPSRTPTWVELRQTPASILRPVDPVGLSARFDGLASFPYLVFVWVPGVGAWKAPKIQVGAGNADVVHLEVPRTGRVVFEVERGELQAGKVDGWVSATGFSALGFDGLAAATIRVEMAPRADGNYEVELLPGEYPYTFLSGQGTSTVGVVHVLEGTEARERVLLQPGLRIEVEARLPRMLNGKEKLELEVRTARGTRHTVGRSKSGRFVVGVPHDTVELLLSSNLGLSGRCEFSSEAARSAETRPKFRIDVVDTR